MRAHFLDSVDRTSELTVSSCSAGGTILISGTGRITLDNTLDERLRLLEDRVRLIPPLRLENVSLMSPDSLLY